MKKKVIGLAGAALFIGGLYVNQAQGASAQERYNTAVEIACESSRDLAYNVMIVRQTPVSEDEQILMIKEVGVEPNAEKSAIRIVKEAHEIEVVNPAVIEITAVTFGQKIKEKCLKDLNGKIL